MYQKLTVFAKLTKKKHEAVKHKRKSNFQAPDSGSQLELSLKHKRVCIQRSVFFPVTLCTAVRTSEYRLQTHCETRRCSSFRCISQQPMNQSGAESLRIPGRVAAFKDYGIVNRRDLAYLVQKCTAGLCIQFASVI